MSRGLTPPPGETGARRGEGIFYGSNSCSDAAESSFPKGFVVRRVGISKKWTPPYVISDSPSDCSSHARESRARGAARAG